MREIREDLLEDSRDAMSRDTDVADTITDVVEDIVDDSNAMDDTPAVNANDDLTVTGDGGLDDLVTDGVGDDVIVGDDDSNDDGAGVGDAIASMLTQDDVSDDSSSAADGTSVNSDSSKEAVGEGMDTIDVEDIFENLSVS